MNVEKSINLLKMVGLTPKEILRYDIDVVDDLLYHTKDFKSGTIQIGGNLNIEFDGSIYKFHKLKQDDRYIYSFRQNRKNGSSNCIVIIIDPLLKYAYLENISNVTGCFEKGKVIDKDGDRLVRLAMEVLRKIKSKHEITHILLRDNSMKTINTYNITLRYLSYLTKGRTYYNKFGFIPCDTKPDGTIVVDKDRTKELLKQSKWYLSLDTNDIKYDQNKLYNFINKTQHHLVKLFIENMNEYSGKFKEFVKKISYDYKFSPILDDLLKYFVRSLKLDIPHRLCLKIFDE